MGSLTKNKVLWIFSVSLVSICYILFLLYDALESSIHSIAWTEQLILSSVVAFGLMVTLLQITVNYVWSTNDDNKVFPDGNMDFRDCIKNNEMPSLDDVAFANIVNEYKFDILSHLPQPHIADVFDSDDSDSEDEDESDANDWQDIDTNPLFSISSFQAKIKKSNRYTLKNDDVIDDGNEYYFTVKLNTDISMTHQYKRHVCLTNIILVVNISSFDEWIPRNTICRFIQLMLHKSILNRKHDTFGLIVFDYDWETVLIKNTLTCIHDVSIEKTKYKILNAKSLNQSTDTDGGIDYDVIYQTCSGLFADTKQDKYEKRVMLVTASKVEADAVRLINKYSCVDHVLTTLIQHRDASDDTAQRISDIKGCCYYPVASERRLLDLVNHKFEMLIKSIACNVNLRIRCHQNNVFFVDDMSSFKREIQINKSNGMIELQRNVFYTEMFDNVVLIKMRQKLDVMRDEKDGLEDAKFAQMLDEGLAMFYEKKNKKYFDEKGKGKFINYLQQFKETNSFTLEVTYHDMWNEVHMLRHQKIQFRSNAYYFENVDMRKLVLLSKYVKIMRLWITRNRHRNGEGIMVSDKYKTILTRFRIYFEKESKSIQDPKLKNECDVLRELCHDA
eukprot:54329_1